MSDDRIDLDDLERMALRDLAPARRGSWVGHRDFARAVVALVTRVRELEGERNRLRGAIDHLRRKIDGYDTTFDSAGEIASGSVSIDGERRIAPWGGL